MARKAVGAKGPSRAEKASQELQEEILEFWKAIGRSELKSWQQPWVYKVMLAENAGNYLLGKERYVYKGGYNQFLIAFQGKDKESDMAPLVMTGGAMAEMFFGKQNDLELKDRKKFGDTPIVKEHHVKSLGSLFMAPKEYNQSTWLRPDGSRWSDPKKKYPSEKEVNDQKLTKHSQKRMHFGTFAVWSAEDVKDFLPEEFKAKLEELVELRRGKGYDFDPEDSIEKFIDDKINDVIKRQGIAVTQHGNEAFYVPQLDVIKKPTKEQFINPVVRYAVTMHELAHSTKHINSRRPSSAGSRVAYAQEEIVAESTAVMMVKQLERQLEHILPKRPDMRVMFDDYYSNAMAYSQGWGGEFNFMESVEAVESSMSENKGIVRTILVDVAKAVETLNNGEYTPEQRHEFKEKNFERVNPSKQQEVKKPEPEESPGMGM